MPASVPHGESRSLEQLREHYSVEKELAERLRRAGRQERQSLYTALYDELFRRVPDHPQLTRKADLQSQADTVFSLKLLKRFLRPDSTFLEIGPGDCALAVEVAKRVKRVYAVDVSEEIVKGLKLPSNFELVLSDGCSIPLPARSVDVAYSDQLMEHLHPEDALEQLRQIYNTLTPGGVYICITPNRLSGPHDISRYFDDTATGFHLKEYTATELMGLLRATGFSKLTILAGARGFLLPFPLSLLRLLEGALLRLSKPFRQRMSRGLPLRLILGIKIIAVK